MAEDKELLKVIGLKKHFGGLKAVDGVDLSVRRGECYSRCRRSPSAGPEQCGNCAGSGPERTARAAVQSDARRQVAAY